MSDAPGSARGSRFPGDSSSNVVNEELFRFLVRLEVNKASRLQYTVSVVCVAPSEDGEEVDPAFASRAAEILSHHFRTTDAFTARPPASIWLLLVNAETRDLPEIFLRVTAELDALKRRKMPVVVLWGANDTIVPRASFDALCDAIGSEGEVVEGSHSWLLADPDAFGEVMTNVLEVAKLAQHLEEEEAAVKPRRRRGLLRLLG